MTYRQMPARNKRPESNQISDHPANNTYGGGRYYQYEHGHDNAITQPTSGLTDIDVGFPPMPVVPTGDYPTHKDMDITHGRCVVANPTRPSLPDRPPEARRPWSPKGRSSAYRSSAKQSRKGNRDAGPGGSAGYNTDA